MPENSRRMNRVRRRRLGLEQLDARVCLAVDISFHEGVLTVRGTEAAEFIQIRDDGFGTVSVQDGRPGPRPEFHGVQRIEVDSGAGNDVIRYTRGTGGDVNPPELDIVAGEGNDDVSIGLLLPAVQKVREAAARMRVDLGAGHDLLAVNTHGIEQVELDISAGTGDDNVLIGLLLPAVQKVREAAARANVDLGEGANVLKVNATSFDDVDLDLTAGTGDDNILIGLLLPAVQKVREAAARGNLDLGEGNNVLRVNTTGVVDVDLDVTTGAGDDSVLIGLLLPAVQKVRAAAARLNLDLGAGNDRLQVDAVGVDDVQLDVAAGDGNDRITVGLLLPAVQKVRESAARFNIDLGTGNDVADVVVLGYEFVDPVFTAADEDPIVNVRRLGPPSATGSFRYLATATGR